MNPTQQQHAYDPEAGSRRSDTLSQTDVARRLVELRESDEAAEAYTENELNHDRVPTTAGFLAWCTRHGASNDGYVVTGAGLRALDGAPTVEATDTASQVLRNAARYLERYGWIQGAYYDATATAFTPSACMVGAIGMVCYGGPVEAPAQHFDDPGYLDFEEAVLHLDRYLLVEDGSESYEFNDAKGRQAGDVIRVLRQAADTPTEELLDAIRAIDVRNAEMAVLAKLLLPCGIWDEPSVSATSAGGDGE